MSEIDWDDEKETRCWVTLRVAVSVYGEEPNDENVRDALVATVEQDPLHRDHISWGVEGKDPEPPVPVHSEMDMSDLPPEERERLRRQGIAASTDPSVRFGHHLVEFTDTPQLLSDEEVDRIEATYPPTRAGFVSTGRMFRHIHILIAHARRLKELKVRDAMHPGGSVPAHVARELLEAVRANRGLDYNTSSLEERRIRHQRLEDAARAMERFVDRFEPCAACDSTEFHPRPGCPIYRTGDPTDEMDLDDNVRADATRRRGKRGER